MRKIFHGVINRNRVVLTEQSQYNSLLRSLEGKDIELSIGTPTKHRSNNQNRYYFGVVIRLLSDETGYTPDEMHDAMRMLFLRDESKKIPTLRSTASLTSSEMEDYLSRIREFASIELHVYVPTPNEVTL